MKEIETGVFGRVIKCVDMRTGNEVALKLSKSDKSEAHYALLESKLLKKIQIQSDDPDTNGIVKMLDSFTFRHHFVIVFELLHINLCTWMYDEETSSEEKQGTLKMIAK